jgi:hypothetical protein
MRILLVLFFLSVFADSFAVPCLSFQSYPDTCRTEKDSLTGRNIYRNADIEPKNAGGRAELLRRMNKGVKATDSALSNEIESQCIVAFIVEIDGHITGGRVIRGNRQVGQQILKVAESLKWTPGKCNGKNVPVFYTLPMNIEYSGTEN